jgi:hypothetical protein
MRLLDFETGAVALSLVACLSLNQAPRESSPLVLNPVKILDTSTASRLQCGMASWNHMKNQGPQNDRFAHTLTHLHPWKAVEGVNCQRVGYAETVQ